MACCEPFVARACRTLGGTCFGVYEIHARIRDVCLPTSAFVTSPRSRWNAWTSCRSSWQRSSTCRDVVHFKKVKTSPYLDKQATGSRCTDGDTSRAKTEINRTLSHQVTTGQPGTRIRTRRAESLGRNPGIRPSLGPGPGPHARPPGFARGQGTPCKQNRTGNNEHGW